jgi:hypothetical protein
MRDAIRGLAGGLAAMIGLAVLTGGCQSNARDELSALPRDGITEAQRADWHRYILWPQDCEDAFQTSHVAGTGGMRIVKLGAAPAVSLVEVTCAAGSYQPSAVRFTLTEDAAGARIVPLYFPVYSSPDGSDLRRTQETEVWGESIVSPASGEIAILTLARQTADCGVWTRYSLARAQPRLLGAARAGCPAAPGTPVSIAASGPPEGWEPISTED